MLDSVPYTLDAFTRAMDDVTGGVNGFSSNMLGGIHCTLRCMASCEQEETADAQQRESDAVGGRDNGVTHGSEIAPHS